MKSFKIHLREVARQGYKLWGLMGKGGRLIPGETSPTAAVHVDLMKKLPRGESSHAVEYAQNEDGSGLMIRTYGKDSLLNAMNNFAKLPHGSGKKIIHDHFQRGDRAPEDTHFGSEVRSDMALFRMNKLLNEYK